MEHIDYEAIANRRHIFNDAELNFDPALASQGRASAASPAVLLSSLKGGDSVVVDAPAGSAWEWMNGKALTVRRFMLGQVWCDVWEWEQGAAVKKEFLVPVELLRRISR